MKILADENLPGPVVEILRKRGHDVVWAEAVIGGGIAHIKLRSELVFRRFGNTEFLSKVFEAGSRTGAELTETKKQEA